MTTWDLIRPVAANQLAADAFFSMKTATQDLTSPVAACNLAAGAVYSTKMATHDLTSRAGPGQGSAIVPWWFWSTGQVL